MAHRTFMGVMSPLNRFSVMPYFIDPMTGIDQRASPWHRNHLQAHNDCALYLPEEYDSTAVGLANWANLAEYRLSDPASRSWWTFANHLEHYVGANSILPPIPTAEPDWTYPFW